MTLFHGLNFEHFMASFLWSNKSADYEKIEPCFENYFLV